MARDQSCIVVVCLARDEFGICTLLKFTIRDRLRILVEKASNMRSRPHNQLFTERITVRFGKKR